MRKRIASLFLVLALCLSLLPTAALAEEIPETTERYYSGKRIHTGAGG